MSYPDFVCMGFQKSGTTTLFDILRWHPQIALCRDVKEPMYYRVAFADVFGLHGRYYRRRYFGHLGKNDKRLKGEINAGLTYTGCAGKIRRDYPRDVKMIFMLRNPVDRSYSAYKYFLARGFLPMWAYRYDAKHGHAQGFDYYARRILENEKKRSRIMDKRLKYLVFSQSNYGACIAEYLNGFELKNMDFVIFEEFIADQRAECEKIYSFLGISKEQGAQDSVKSNEGNERAVSVWRAKLFCIVKGINYALYDLLAMPHWAAGLYGKFQAFYKRVRKKCLAPDMDKSKALPSTRKYLMEYYSGDIEKLERIIGRDLSEVWKLK